MQTLLLDNAIGTIFGGFTGILGLIHAIFVIIAFYSIWTNKSMSGTAKLLWGAVVFFMPGLGLILWWLFGK